MWVLMRLEISGGSPKSPIASFHAMRTRFAIAVTLSTTKSFGSPACYANSMKSCIATLCINLFPRNLRASLSLGI